MQSDMSTAGVLQFSFYSSIALKLVYVQVCKIKCHYIIKSIRLISVGNVPGTAIIKSKILDNAYYNIRYVSSKEEHFRKILFEPFYLMQYYTNSTIWY